MSSGPSYTNRAPGADDGAPPPYIPSQVSMPTPATFDTTNQQAATTLDTGYQPSPRMPVPQTHTTTPNNVSSSSYSASPSSKHGAGSRSQSAPAPAPQPISSTTNYYYQAPATAAMYVPIVTDPPTQGQWIQFILSLRPLEKLHSLSECRLRARKTSAYDEVRCMWDIGSDCTYWGSSFGHSWFH